ncbi:ABC transporter permease [Leucobacter albus]|uniref:ABC transporter permease n=1 Tax=Leucobacter albus TaxID=272210 RepID=A0ABW3TP57_9MICO
MTRYIVQRLLALLPVVLVVSIVIFSITYLTPGDPARNILGPDASQAQVDALRDSLGLNAPLVTQYFSWLGGVLTGDLGESFFMRKPVLTAIADNFLPTLQLATIAIAVALGVAIPFGTLAARYRGSGLDQTVTVATLLSMAVPSFVLGLLLMVVFAVNLRWFPVAGYVNPFTDFGAGIKTLILPGVALGTIVAALITRTTRAAVLDVLNSGYIDAARSRGVSNLRLLFAHTLKNAGLPVLTNVGLVVGSLVTGAAVTETIFNIPGLGSLLVQAITRRDYTIIQGVVLAITLCYLLVNLIIDLLYGLVDPRVRLGRKSGE